jgi:hypothetical protein
MHVEKWSGTGLGHQCKPLCRSPFQLLRQFRGLRIEVGGDGHQPLSNPVIVAMLLRESHKLGGSFSEMSDLLFYPWHRTSP